MMYVIGADSLDGDKPNFKATDSADRARARFRLILQAISGGSALPDNPDHYPGRVAVFKVQAADFREAIEEVRDRRGGTLLIDSADPASIAEPYERP